MHVNGLLRIKQRQVDGGPKVAYIEVRAKDTGKLIFSGAISPELFEKAICGEDDQHIWSETLR